MEVKNKIPIIENSIRTISVCVDILADRCCLLISSSFIHVLSIHPFLRAVSVSIVMKLSAIITIAAAFGSTCAQHDQYPDYNDYADGYEQDNLYENYAMQKEVDNGGG